MMHGKRVTLGPIEERDLPKLYEWINSPDLVRLNAPYRPVHATSHAEWFAKIGRIRSRVIFAIRSRAKRQLIGAVQLVGIDSIHRNAEVIIRIGAREQQGKGKGSEALRLILSHAWGDLNLHRVTAHAFATNKRAIAAYTKVGFEIEGTMREASFINGSWTDLVVLGVLNPSEH
jgi:RimJ/RimL family protein N-acetyltransferase